MIRFLIEGVEDVQAVRNRIAQGYPKIFQRVHSALSASALDLVGHIKINKLSGQVLKRRSGRLSRSIHANPVEISAGAMSVQVGTNVEYARIHELGGQTKPHLIKARGRSLRWVDSGGFTFSAKTGKVTDGFIYRKEVHHPGSKIPARPYLRPALEEKRQAIVERINQAVHQAVVEMGGSGV